MKTDFINADFLLESPLARNLYHDYVEGLPVADYHNHLNPADLASDRSFSDIGELWVASDPYKHRAMRLHGEPEEFISGGGSTRTKFDAWARTLPSTLGNPLFHWSAMEMKNVFGLDEMPDEESAGRVWDACNACLSEDSFSTLGILRRFGVRFLSTSDDLLDAVSVHASVKGGVCATPSLRADSILGFGREWMQRLCASAGACSAASLEEYLLLVRQRLDAFSTAGCRVADHALDDGWRFEKCPYETAARLYEEGSFSDVRLKSYVLGWLASEYAGRGWAMLLHIGAQRFTSSRLRSLAGPAGGYASIGSPCDIRSLCAFLDSQDAAGLLPKTVLFTLNPADNAALATLTGSYSEDGVAGKVQFGPAWWYNDHFLGMTEQMECLMSYSLLPQFIGMTTDSRNVLSFSRHDYFRRILCNFMADKALRGHSPSDEAYLGKIASDIAYNNALSWIYGK